MLGEILASVGTGKLHTQVQGELQHLCYRIYNIKSPKKRNRMHERDYGYYHGYLQLRMSTSFHSGRQLGVITIWSRSGSSRRTNQFAVALFKYAFHYYMHLVVSSKHL